MRRRGEVDAERSRSIRDRPVLTLVAAVMFALLEIISRPWIGRGRSSWTSPRLDWRNADSYRLTASVAFVVLFILCVIRLAQSRALWPRAVAVLITALFASSAMLITYSAWTEYDPCRGRSGLCHPAFYIYSAMTVIYSATYVFATSALFFAVARWRGALVAMLALMALIPITFLAAISLEADPYPPSKPALIIWAIFSSGAVLSVIISVWLRHRSSPTETSPLQ